MNVFRQHRTGRRARRLGLSQLLCPGRHTVTGLLCTCGRQFVVSVDGSYTNRTVLKALPERTTLIGRIREDAELFHPPRAEDQPAVGSKRRYGQAAPTPEPLRQDETADLYRSGSPARTTGPVFPLALGH